MDEIEKGIFDFDDDLNVDVKIRPNFYIHNAILMAQRTLLFSVAKSTVTDGLTAYSILIEQIEVLSKAAQYIDEKYYNSIEEFKKTKEYQEVERKDVKLAKLSNKKLELLMFELFSRSPTHTPMKA